MKSLVVVTGASSGIGEAIARRFSKAGHPLLLLARRLDRMEAMGLPNALCEQVDMTDPVGVRSAVAKAEAEYGPVDCLVNNAGVMLLGSVDDQDPAEWRRMYEINVLALLDAMQVVLGPMRERKHGTIFNISSVAGLKAFPDHAAYTGSKFAVSGITENVREEVADDNVRVISICPGATTSELIGHTTDASIKGGYEEWKTEIGGALEADDVARSVLFAYEQPQSMCIRQIVMAPTRQAR